MPAGFAAPRALAGGLALVDKSFFQEARQLDRRIGGELRVITALFRGEQCMQHVVPIVVPLGVVAVLEKTGVVVLVFEYQVDVAIGSRGAANAAGEFDKETLL